MTALKCCLDSNVLDWIMEDGRGPELTYLIKTGMVSAIVAADNAHEVHRIPDHKAEKRARLQAFVKSSFLPLAPTHVPIAGIARSGLARIATPSVMELQSQLQAVGISGLDSNHLINASREECQVFVTLDKGILKKHDQIHQILKVECVTPNDLLTRFQPTTNRDAG